jgi:hypothetical protein
MGVEKAKLEQYAIVEMMGHRKVIGKITESDIGTGSLLKVTVLGKDGEPERTEYIGVGSIYCLTIVTEEVAKSASSHYSPEPTWAYALNRPQLTGIPQGGYVDADESDDDQF